jgi:signal transduction histidine kinase
VKNRSLLFRLIAAFAVVIIVALLAVFVFMTWSTAAEFERFRDRVDAQRATDLRIALARYYAVSGDWTGVQPYVKHIGAMWDWRIIVTDPENTVVADSDEALLGTRYDESLGAGLLMSPIGERQPFGSLYIEPQTPPGAERALLSLALKRIGLFLLLGMIVAFAASVAMAWFLSHRILSPVQLLRHAVQKLGAGDLSQRVNLTDQGEIGELASAFNAMANGLERADQVQRQMIGDIAHELRTPLSNIRGYIEAVRDRVIEPDEETIATLDGEAVLLSRLVDDLQELSMVEAGQMALEFQPEDIVELVAHSMDAMSTSAAARGVHMERTMDADLPLVTADYHRISQVMRNLLDNALTHTSEGGSITVGALRSGDFVEVSVSDTGEGIEAEDLPHIFDRFYRADRSRTRATGGRGLGLTISKGLVEAHGGSLTVESTPGKGSRFCFALPAFSEEAPAEKQPGSSGEQS